MTPNEDLKRLALSWLLKVTIAVSCIAGIVHFLESDPALINLIVPPLSVTGCCLLLLRLRQPTANITQVGQLFAALVVTLVAGCNLYFVGQAVVSKYGLVDTMPGPFTVSIPLPLMVLTVFVSPHRLKQSIGAYWVAIALPVFAYLLLHPEELTTLRGQELAFLTGPIMIGQIIFLLLYARLRDIAEHLYTERLQYYTKIVEKQSIRQQAIDQTLAQIHNGPLQTLAVLLLDAHGQKLDANSALIKRLEQLNTEIRAVGDSLIDNTQSHLAIKEVPKKPEDTPSERTLRLGTGEYLDLNLPTNELFYQVFSATITRDLPHFKTVRAKMRNFEVIQSDLDFDHKRELCLWLEEAMCNIGKHAAGATRIKAVGQMSESHYTLTVQDNGRGLQTTADGVANQHQALANRLGGQFRRSSSPSQGTICQISWPVVTASLHSLS